MQEILTNLHDFCSQVQASLSQLTKEERFARGNKLQQNTCGSLLDHDITSLSGKKVFLVIVSSDNGCPDIIEYPNMIVCSYNGLSLDQTTLLHPLLSLSILQVSIFT